MSMAGRLDVTMVAARRPDLVDLTLRSFRLNLLDALDAPHLILNIDPVWGTAADDQEVEAVCRRYFQSVEVRRPERPCFGGAVKWAWGRVQTEWFLHLEDDWLLARRIDTEGLAERMADPDLGQIKLSNKSRYRRLKGRLRRWRKHPEMIATSPSIIRSSFARVAVAFMNPDLDPEKQFYQGFNPAGAAALERFGSRVYGNLLTPCLLYDTGRVWRQVRGMKKRVVDGQSVWEETERKRASQSYAFQQRAMEARLLRSRHRPPV